MNRIAVHDDYRTAHRPQRPATFGEWDSRFRLLPLLLLLLLLLLPLLLLLLPPDITDVGPRAPSPGPGAGRHLIWPPLSSAGGAWRGLAGAGRAHRIV